MKLFNEFVTFAITFLTTVQCYRMKKIEGVVGSVVQIEFDAHSNSFVITESNSSYVFYKLDNKNNIILTKELSGWSYLITNKRNDVYIFAQDDQSNLELIWFVKAKSESVKLLFIYQRSGCGDTINFIDKDDIIYINHFNGVAFFRSGKHIPLTVTNLEKYRFCHHGEDEEGNVYLAPWYYGAVFVIPKEAKKSPVLYANILPGFANIGIDKFTKGYQNNVFALFNNDELTANVKRLMKNSTELLFSKYGTGSFNFYATKKRYFLSNNDIFHTTSCLYILTPDKQIEKIEDEIAGYLSFKQAQTDSEGNVFFPFLNLMGEAAEGGIALIKHDKLKIKRISVPSKKKIDSLAIDDDDNVWILARELYLLSKGSDDMKKVSDFFADNVSEMKSKETSKEIFIGGNDGLHVFTY